MQVGDRGYRRQPGILFWAIRVWYDGWMTDDAAVISPNIKGHVGTFGSVLGGGETGS